MKRILLAVILGSLASTAIAQEPESVGHRRTRFVATWRGAAFRSLQTYERQNSAGERRRLTRAERRQFLRAVTHPEVRAAGYRDAIEGFETQRLAREFSLSNSDDEQRETPILDWISENWPQIENFMRFLVEEFLPVLFDIIASFIDALADTDYNGPYIAADHSIPSPVEKAEVIGCHAYDRRRDLCLSA